MAELADGRVYKRKRVKDPTDESNFIDIPVLYQANFKTMQEQAQEHILYFNNSSTSSRKVHTHRVTNPIDGSYLDVERIDVWYSKSMQEQAQEYAHILKNIDPPPMQPDGTNNPAHEQTHIVRYFPENVAGPTQRFIDVELIDVLKIVDASSQYQEWFWYLKHPELGNLINDPDVPYVVTQGYCDPSLSLATDESALGIDSPWRLDPFQNIINVKWTSEESTTAGYPTLWFYPAWATDHLWYLFYTQSAGYPPPPETQTHTVVATLEITEEQYFLLLSQSSDWTLLREIFPEVDQYFDQWAADYYYYLTHPGTPYPPAPIIACPASATA